MRLATIDIGTNTAQLLIVEHDDSGLRRCHAVERFVRLGEGVDEKGRIGTAAQERLFDTLRSHRDTAREYAVDEVVAAGTSALRDAANRQAVLDRVQDELGWTVDILSGENEAAWSFAAACDAFNDLRGSCLVVDVGGGSTELIAGTDPASHRPHYVDAITGRSSLDVGCVRLTERCLSAQPPSDDAVAEVERLIAAALEETALSVDSDTTLIGTAGTATALALVHAGPDSTWDALHGGGFTLTRADVRHWRDRVHQLSVEDILALHPGAMEGRADVFPIGVILLDRILAHYDLDGLRVSPYELRHGLALRHLAASSTTIS